MEPFTFGTLQRVLRAQQAQEAVARTRAVEDAAHAYEARMGVPDALWWCARRAGEHGYRGELRDVFMATFVDSLAALDVGLGLGHGASADDDMTCARCGGHFERWEGADNPEPTCPVCLA